MEYALSRELICYPQLGFGKGGYMQVKSTAGKVRRVVSEKEAEVHQRRVPWPGLFR